MPVIWGRAEVADRWRGRRRRRTRRRRRRMASPALQILLFWNISDLSGLKTGLKITEILSQPPVQTSPQLTHLLFLVAKVVFNLKSEEGGRWRVLFDLIFNYLIPFILYQKLDKLDFVSLKVWKITSCSSELCVSRLGKQFNFQSCSSSPLSPSTYMSSSSILSSFTLASSLSSSARWPRRSSSRFELCLRTWLVSSGWRNTTTTTTRFKCTCFEKHQLCLESPHFPVFPAPPFLSQWFFSPCPWAESGNLNPPKKPNSYKFTSSTF